MARANLLYDVLKRNRLALGLTYSLSFSEPLLELLIPWVIGQTINGLMKHDYNNLFIFVSLWLLLTFISAARKIYDTRVFMRIYTSVVMNVLTEQMALGTPTGKLVARSVLLQTVVDFFERDIPQIFSMLVNFIGSLAMLALFDWHLAMTALAMLIPVSILNAVLWRPVNKLNRCLNNNLERQGRIISTGSKNRLWQHFQFLRFMRTKASNIAASSWSLIEMFVVLATVYVLIYTAAIPNIQAGTIFSIVTYFWNFQGSLDRLPVLMQSVSQVRDILRRVHEDIESASNKRTSVHDKKS